MILDNFDVIVIGAGHAGIEAALASSRLGSKTALFTSSLDAIGNMPCNPAIGGTAKGHLVREIDALGGEMGKAADATFLQSRMLNTGKGAAVQSLRVQSDRMRYHLDMKRRVEAQENLFLFQSEITDIIFENKRVTAVKNKLDITYGCKAVVIATGTYLGGKIFVGDTSYESGPDGVYAATQLTKSLIEGGVKLRRFKTGTPARVHRRSIDFSMLEEQLGDDPVIPLSFETPGPLYNKRTCHIAYTNEETHRVIRANIHRSPLYGGKIEGIGPRYCPSIEDKVVRFPDKTKHQIFIEPCGEDTEEMYLQGMSSSLPFDVQDALYRTIKGFENIEILRPAYAIEYDCCDSLELYASLMFKNIPGLFGAGQFNGSSGYEEAAAQGLVAGMNAARYSQGKDMLIFSRTESYIGTLIDDLVTKGVSDPYRMMTSRSEYRLLLRQDNADDRLTPIGREIGLVDDIRWEHFLARKDQKEREIKRLFSVSISPKSDVNKYLEKVGSTCVDTGIKLGELIKRPGVTYDGTRFLDTDRPELSGLVCFKVETEIKYEGYIKQQLHQVEQQKKLERKILPEDISYENVRGLRIEATEKLSKIRPHNIGQAGRISGVSPADITVLLIYLEKWEREKNG